MSPRMLDVLMRGISTRQYAEVLPEMALSCGVSKSSVSREVAEAGEEALKELLERRFDKIDLLVIYIDGMQFGEHHVISAVGVDRAGHKHVLGIQQGALRKRGGGGGFTGAVSGAWGGPEGQALVRDRRRQSVAGLRSTNCLERSIRCSPAAITRSATCATDCRRNRRIR